jgi:hypothetical protein
MTVDGEGDGGQVLKNKISAMAKMTKMLALLRKES